VNAMVRALLPAVLGAVALSAAGCVAPGGAMQTDPNKARIDARDALRQAAESPDRFARSAALEAMAEVWGPAAAGSYMEGLNDPYPNVRFAAAMAIGDVRYAPAASKLQTMAQFKAEGAERDKRAYIGVVYALHRLGRTRHTRDLGTLLFDREAPVRANVAMVMGKMGEPSAVAMLRSLAHREQKPRVRIQAWEALAVLGDQRSVMSIEARARVPFPLDSQLVALQALGRLRTRSSIGLLRRVLNSSKQPPQARVRAAESLAKTSGTDDYGFRLCLASVRHPRQVMEAAIQEATGKAGRVENNDVSMLRELAVTALGWMDRPEAIDSLHPLLKNDSARIRVVAARSILRLLPDQEAGQLPAKAKK